MCVTFVCEGGSVEGRSIIPKLLLICKGSDIILNGIYSPVVGSTICFPSTLLVIPVTVDAGGLLFCIDYCINNGNYCDPLCCVVKVVELIARLCSLTSSSSSSLILLLKGLIFRCSGD